MGRRERIKAAITTKPYIYSLIIIFILYIALNAWINKWHIFLPGLGGIFWYISVPYVLLGIIIAFLVALAINLTYMRVREIQKMSGTSGLTLVGVFFGIATGACPGCLVGILPAIIGFFGGTFSLNSLPLLGIEIQIVTIAIMVFAVRMLAKDNTCKIKT